MGPQSFCRMSQNVEKLRFQIAQVPLYLEILIIKIRGCISALIQNWNMNKHIHKVCYQKRVFLLVWFNATFNNTSVISWRSVLLVEETGVLTKIHQPAASHWQTLSHNIVSSSPRLCKVRTHNVSGDRYKCSCKSNYHTVTSMTAPMFL